MKNLGKFAILGAVLAASATSVFAATLGSWATGASNLGNINTAMTWDGYSFFLSPPPGTSPVVSPFSGGGFGSAPTTWTLNPEGVWAPALANSTWVGIAATAGPTGNTPPQTTTNPPYGYYEFNTTFTLGAGTWSGNLTVLADDTTEVYLDGSKIVSFADLGNDGVCAQGAPGCISTDSLSVALSGLGAGGHTLTFIVEQAGIQLNNPEKDPSGVDFDATLTSNVTPEPSSLLLLGTGLLGAAGMAFRRRVIA